MASKKDLAKFQTMLNRAGVTYFKAHEFFYLGDSNQTLQTNTDPPDWMWANMIPTAKVLQMVRSEVGVPIRISSAYRNPTYNRQVGGKKESLHKQFIACDIQALSNPVKYAKIIRNVALEARQAGLWIGGLGRYNTFTHIDTRGYNATWG